MDEIEDLCGDSHVDPLNNGEIILYPLRIMKLRKRVVGNVRVEIALPKVYVEEVTPMVVVVRRKV